MAIKRNLAKLALKASRQVGLREGNVQVPLISG